MKFLQELLLDGTDIKGLPLSIVLLSGIVQLDLKGCKNISCLSNFISALKFLSTLNLSDGTAIRELSLSVELLTGLVVLNLKDWQYLSSLPSTINGLKSLKILNLSSCSKLENVPENLGKVESLEELDI
ncbi:hypothetical protein CISIN_1g040556mg, partial [Citrus sinensis]